MIIFLHGPDSFRSRKKLAEIVEHYEEAHKSGLNLRYLDLKEQDFQDFEDDFQTKSMFKEKKLIIIKNAFANQDFKEKFIKNIKKIKKLDDIIVIYEDKEIAKNNSLLNLLKKEGRCQEFKELTGLRLRNWTRKELDKYQVEIEPRALDLLINYTGGDLWQLSNEINKLVNYTKHISLAVVNGIVKGKIETDIFKTIDAIAVKNKKLALFLIHKHLSQGDSPLYLFSMIIFQFRNLLLVKNSFSTKIPGMHPYVARKSFFQSRKFNSEELKKIYHKLSEVDFNIKTGKIEPITALDLLIASV